MRPLRKWLSKKSTKCHVDEMTLAYNEALLRRKPLTFRGFTHL